MAQAISGYQGFEDLQDKITICGQIFLKSYSIQLDPKFNDMDSVLETFHGTSLYYLSANVSFKQLDFPFSKLLNLLMIYPDNVHIFPVYS